MSQKRIVICGGGIIGCSTAYFLAKMGQTNITVVECGDIAGQASGKAGGFLAIDWNDGSPVEALARRSFQLHAQIANELAPLDLGYRTMRTISVKANEIEESKTNFRAEGLPSWIDARVRGVDELGGHSSTAQVHPAKLTRAMMDFAVSVGAKVVKGKVENVVSEPEGDRQVTGVIVDGQTFVADVVVIALGPWSGIAANFFPGSGLPKITGTRAHSIVMDLKEAEIGAEAIFLSYTDSDHQLTDPEIYPRNDGTVYVCGMSDQEPLPSDPNLVTHKTSNCEKLASIASHVSSSIKKKGKVIQQQACYLPGSPDGHPLIGKVPGYKGAFIATGHSCWGILNGPATGEVLAQMIEGKEPSVNVDRLLPGRFLKFK